MMASPPLQRGSRRPILILLVVLLVPGLFTFRNYGLSWDEPLFYAYGDALGYAYTPANWFGGNFDLSLSYGPSGTDHRNRGPAYLVLARGPAHLLEGLGLAQADAWHLLNFLTFLGGVYFLYCLSERWMRPGAAFAAAAMFAAQPLLWGHAFINPKDMPFMVFFLGSVWLGFRMVDRLDGERPRPLGAVLLAAAFLGITTSMRVLGPLAGLIVVIYFLLRQPARRGMAWLALYAAAACLAAMATWPYLWDAPLARFLEVLRFMSDNPTGLTVLFAGQYYRAYELPHRYLPFFLAATLTEPVWFLFAAGLIIAVKRTMSRRLEWRSLTLILGWFALLLSYVLVLRPPMYDGMRHFLFILPPVFIVAGLAIDALFDLAWRGWVISLIAVALLIPGCAAALQLHPYEYAYYNSFAGGTRGAFRNYETEYWLTCYKEAVETLIDRIPARPSTLFVHREAYIAASYAPDWLTVRDERGALNEIRAGDYVLVNTRSNEDRKTFPDAPAILKVGRAGATFCVIKQVP
jgi:hypothetical protein